MTEERLKLIQNAGIDYKLDEIAYCKYQIQQRLIGDSDLLEVLHNPELEKNNAVPEDYLNSNIYSYLRIPDTQSVVKNFVCFEVSDYESSPSNNVIVRKQIQFRTVSNVEDIETPYGINRQDLLAMLVKDDFDWSTLLNMTLKKVTEYGGYAENGYYYRTITYQTEMQNTLQRGTPMNYKFG